MMFFKPKPKKKVTMDDCQREIDNIKKNLKIMMDRAKNKVDKQKMEGAHE